MQLPFYLGTNSVVIRNAKKVHTYGAELAADWQATDSLKLTTGLGLLNTKIKSYPDSGIEGNKLGRAPKYTANIGVKYLNDKGWEAGGDVRFYGGYYSAADNAESGKISAYNQVNLYTAYNFKQGRVSLYADNVLNRRRPHIHFQRRPPRRALPTPQKRRRERGMEVLGGAEMIEVV